MVNSIAQPLVYSRPCTTATTDPYTALLHTPDEIKEWVGVEEAAIAFSASMADSEPLYDGWSPANVEPSSEQTVQDCMDCTIFSLANQLGGSGGLADINFCANPRGHQLGSAYMHWPLHMHVLRLSVLHCVMQGLPIPATVTPLNWWRVMLHACSEAV